MTHATQHAPNRLLRRGLILGGLGTLAGTAVFAARWYNVSADISAGALSVQDAHIGAARGDFVLIDIRRPDEWTATGVAEGAKPLDMRRSDFLAQLVQLAGGDTAAPIALICARGVRSRRLSAALQDAGFTAIMDVPEGMLGSGAGPGWLKSGLPVVRL